MKVDYYNMDYLQDFSDVNPGEFFFLQDSSGWTNLGYIKIETIYAAEDKVYWNAICVTDGSPRCFQSEDLVYCIPDTTVINITKPRCFVKDSK